ncbi:ScbA/BarX family gamma-butyrolactone biosynthesis protein [Streptomyces sclerotialus]|uniref:ScbA/BarX family gamma-butyrolactone biosynthesis protein n=1 Tax=Streptomyces sclerotialus TaxID=1957 RepID=UPI0018C97D28
MPRSLVHRAAVTEVFLTDGRRTDDGRVLIAAQWPCNHGLYRPDAAGFSDPVLLVETVRQAAIYTSHRFYGVPLTHRFIFRSLDFHIDDADALRVAGAPLEVVLDGALTPEVSRCEKRFGARFTARVEVGGQHCARVSVRLLAVGEQLYSMLRHRGSTPATTAAHGNAGPRTAARMLPAPDVGQSQQGDVLISLDPATAADSYLVRLDRDHPGYFEHACDHVPGMALVEAFRQTAHHLLRREEPATGTMRRMPISCEVSFDAFGELEEPLAVEIVNKVRTASPTGRHRISMAAVQRGRTLARAHAVYHAGPTAQPGEEDSWSSSSYASSAR